MYFRHFEKREYFCMKTKEGKPRKCLNWLDASDSGIVYWSMCLYAKLYAIFQNIGQKIQLAASIKHCDFHVRRRFVVLEVVCEYCVGLSCTALDVSTVC